MSAVLNLQGMRINKKAPKVCQDDQKTNTDLDRQLQIVKC